MQATTVSHATAATSRVGELRGERFTVQPQASMPMDSAMTTSTQRATGPGRRKQLARLCQRTRTLRFVESLRALLRDELRILAYHRVLPAAEPEGFEFDVELISATATGFRRQMALLKRRMHPMRFDEVVACIDAGRRLPPRAILVTFDDGYDDNYRIAYPILRDLDMSAMFFVSTGHIDSGMPYAYDWLVHMVCTTSAGELRAPELGRQWDLPDSLAGRRAVVRELLDALKFHDAVLQSSLIARLEQEWGMPRREHPDCRPMTWEQLREMRQGGMEVGSHGVNHLMLAKLSTADMAKEVHDSKHRLESELGAPVQALSYPVGGMNAFNATVTETVRAAGFGLACSYIAGTSIVRPESRYSLRRLPVERDMDLAWFEAVVALPELFSYPSRRLAS